ncbi:MAG: PadR family transcriptional regulator [Gemmatimonadetes bacterium]|nr:PadR family transcriptional regulator [Gemmatimonadota bacterium]MDA1103335.1 PadR family transcriptional regulator [Gemmatimonadota bacterium]
MTSRNDALAAHLPLRPVDFHILLVLTDGDLHGYGIVKEIQERSQGRIQLEPGNLYRHIRTLVEAGMIEAAERRPSGGGGDERRRYYRVLPFGREVLAADAMRMRALVAAAAARVSLPVEGS